MTTILVTGAFGQIGTELTRALRKRHGADRESEGSTETEASIRYRLATTVPENWIPFIPVRVEGSNREIQLQRGAMLRTMAGVEDTPKIEPRTNILREGLVSGNPYYVYEEEIPRSGVIVSETYQRARWHGGKVFLWLGRRKKTGRGERSSGLQFDQIERAKGS